MRYHIYIAFLLLVSACRAPVNQTIPQEKLDRINAMADVPQPLEIIDFRRLAQRFDSTVYDFNASGEWWPLIWIDSSRKNYPQPVAGIYTAIGDSRQGPQHHKGMFHEALATMGGVLSATLVGIDKSNQGGQNYVGMLKNYFNRDTHWNIMMNNTCPEVAALGGGYGRDWWYDVYPNVLFYAIFDQYPDQPGFDTIARQIADKFYSADSVLNGNYDYSFFDYATLTPMRSHICFQQDAAAGHAWVLYSAYKKFNDRRYLKGAISALWALESQPVNPSYEVLMPFGAYMAARLNATEGAGFSVRKMLGWTFDGTAKCREGWGFLTGNWNGFDISGIVGSTVDHGGYGFLMNTYDAAWPLVSLVRYDPSYAAAIGKWMLNAANAARLFYPAYIPAEHQTLPQLAGVTKGVIGYEGLVKKSTFDQYAAIPAPVAQGDGPKWVPGENPDVTQFSVYGSAHAGIFGGIIRNTNVTGILQIDLLATDFFRDSAYPSYLYYNPFPESKTVRFSSGGTAMAVDLYDAVTDDFIARNVSGGANIKLLPGQAAVIVCTPAGGKVSLNDKGQKLVNGVVINYLHRHSNPVAAAFQFLPGIARWLP